MSCRHCSGCYRLLPETSYNRREWIIVDKGKSRCLKCVQSGGGHAYDSFGQTRAKLTERGNNASCAAFFNHDLERPFQSGGFRWVAKGRYTEGIRKGEDCVCKWFKTGAVYESIFFSLDIKANSKALYLIKEWNSRHFINKVVKLNMPEIWTFESSGNSSWHGRKVLQEPFIHNYTKYNSNSGWVENETPWPRVMQALSHFSYHISGRQYLLCDLQGGEGSDALVLTDPCIISETKEFGVTDLGTKGISSFFSNHKCNEFCLKEWVVPFDRKRYFQPKKGTSMINKAKNNNLRVTKKKTAEYLY